jgi:hypothetical protein
VLRRRLVRAGRDDQPGLAHPVGLELLDHHAVEQRAQLMAGHASKSRGALHSSSPEPLLRHPWCAGVPVRVVASAPDRPGPRAPRIRDVAERAGVGIGTVSRVLNDSAGVAEATRFACGP